MSDYESSESIFTDTNTDTEDKLTPRWQVILVNDEEHSYEFVIALIQEVFKKDFEEAFQLTKSVDMSGSAVITVCSKERAELYQQQVHAWGADPSMILTGRASTGPIQCSIEPIGE